MLLQGQGRRLEPQHPHAQAAGTWGGAHEAGMSVSVLLALNNPYSLGSVQLGLLPTMQWQCASAPLSA